MSAPSPYSRWVQSTNTGCGLIFMKKHRLSIIQFSLYHPIMTFLFDIELVALVSSQNRYRQIHGCWQHFFCSVWHRAANRSWAPTAMTNKLCQCTFVIYIQYTSWFRFGLKLFLAHVLSNNNYLCLTIIIATNLTTLKQLTMHPLSEKNFPEWRPRKSFQHFKTHPNDFFSPFL